MSALTSPNLAFNRLVLQQSTKGFIAKFLNIKHCEDSESVIDLYPNIRRHVQGEFRGARSSILPGTEMHDSDSLPALIVAY